MVGDFSLRVAKVTLRVFVAGLADFSKNNLGDVWSFLGLFMGEIGLKNGFESSGELFGAVLV